MPQIVVIKVAKPVVQVACGPGRVILLKQGPSGPPGAVGSTGAPGQPAIAAQVSVLVPAGVESLAITSPLAPGIAQGISISVQQPADGEVLVLGGWSGSLDAPVAHFAGSISTNGTHILQVTFFN